MRKYSLLPVAPLTLAASMTTPASAAVRSSHGGHAARQMKGSSPQSNNTKAVTWKRKLGLQSALGFEASTESGYDKGAQLTYLYLHSGRLCGTNGAPGGSPRQLVARQQ